MYPSESLLFPNDVSRNTVLELVKKAGIEDSTISLTMASKKGDNFLGMVYRIHVDGRSCSGEEVRRTFILKMVPPYSRDKIRIGLMYERELFCYQIMFPMIEEMHRQHGIPERDRFKYPKCHGGSLVDRQEFLLLDDLAVEGFVLYDKLKSLTSEHMDMLMVTLASWHAFSFALRTKDRAKYYDFVARVRSGEEHKDMDNFRNYTTMIMKSNLKMMDDRVTFDAVEKLSHVAYDLYLKGILSGSMDPFSVICHGDFWINNFLFRYEVS